ncbi:hypothetical protein SEVIR_3G400850v4 [Setaria viridis]|nr:uncharacterized protein LOC117848070 [Setaria viridis]
MPPPPAPRSSSAVAISTDIAICLEDLGVGVAVGDNRQGAAGATRERRGVDYEYKSVNPRIDPGSVATGNLNFTSTMQVDPPSAPAPPAVTPLAPPIAPVIPPLAPTVERSNSE